MRVRLPWNDDRSLVQHGQLYLGSGHFSSLQFQLSGVGVHLPIPVHLLGVDGQSILALRVCSDSD